MNKREVGIFGEKQAAQYLRNKRYKILNMNFRCRQGEIDIVAKDGNTIVFVEVKTRRSSNFGKGMEAVDFHKQQKIRKVALYYLNKYTPTFRDIRFDVVDILLNQEHVPEIIHIKNAF